MRYLKTSALAMLGLCIFGHNANAILLKASNDEYAQISLKMEIWAQNNDATYTNDHSSTNFSVAQTKLYFAGQINPIVQFGADLDFADNGALGADGSARTHQGVPYTMVRDAFINFHFNKSLNVMSGLFLNPWSRYELEYTWSFYIPTENFIPEIGTINNDITNILKPSNNNKLFITPLVSFNLGGDPQFKSALRDMGVVFWGDIAKDNMLKYYAFIGNGKYDYQDGQNGNSNLKYGLRLEFTPTFLGYKGEGAYVDQDTYLGNRNTLTFGIAYQQQKIECGTNATTGQTNYCPAGLSQANSSTTAKAYTLDVLWEQKFGDFVPNFQAAWLDQKDLGYATAGNSVAQPEVQGYYAQTQILYDRMVGIGKPAFAIRYEEDDDKNYYTYNKNFVDAKINMLSFAIDYYISGLNADVGLEATRTMPNQNLINATASSNNKLQSFWDYTLALRTVF